MNREELLYLAPYSVSLVILAGIFLYATRQTYIRGARPFAWMVSGQILTILAFIFGLISRGLEMKLFWDMTQWLTTAFLVILPFLVFVIRFSEYRLRSPSFTWGMILTVLGIFGTFLLTDNLHHLFYDSPRLTPGEPFSELTYDFTFAVYAYLLLYFYAVTVYGISLLIWRALQPRNVFRLQYLIIAAGFLIPLIISILTLVKIQLIPEWNLTPFAFTISSLIVAWGLFHFSLFDIAPIAREHIVENMSDPVIVLDPRDRIIDINKAALKLIEKQKSDVIGQTPEIALANWHSLLETVKDPFLEQKGVFVANEDKTLFLDVSNSYVFGQRLEPIGRIITIHDKTKLKELEIDHQMLSKEVEQRIQQRTEELLTTAERYRTIVENHTDFIVRWKPDGTRTYVNEAYCRYWGITPEQALARNFLFHTSEEDRVDIEKKILRLNSGTTDVETEIYPVTKPDGSIAWQEWSDKAIRDEWGKLIEIQSIGRDITERKRKEENPDD